jgi:hypothetical protein
MPQRINELRKDVSVIAFGVLLPLPKTETYASVRIFGFKKQHLIHESDLFFERRQNLLSPGGVELCFLVRFKRAFDDEGAR